MYFCTCLIRINEVLSVKYGEVRFQSGYVAIDVTSSKTDRLRKGREVVIASGSSVDTCPVNSFETLFNLGRALPFRLKPLHF